MLIEVFADFSCPWCFIGRRRLARACVMRPHLPSEIIWQPFQLNPELPPEGIDRRVFRRARGIDADRLASMERVLTESGRKEGIGFAFDRIARIPNTMAAHRLVRFAMRARLEEAMADHLFTAYFEHGADIGATDTLVALAVDVGLEPKAVRAFLIGNEEAEWVTSVDALGHQSGIAGVPYFIFDRRFALAGAQEPASFLPLFDALLVSGDDLMASSA